MAQTPSPSSSRQSPSPGVPVIQSFPTPNIADRIQIVRADTRLGGFHMPTKGDAFEGADANKFEGFQFATARPADQVGWVDLFYVNERLNQDAYNFSIEYPWVSNEHPRVTRTYVTLRDDLAKPEAGMADPVYSELQLVDYKITRSEDPVIDALFIAISIVFERLTAQVGFVVERMESVLPYNMRVAVPGETVSSVEAGVAELPTLTPGDWRVEEKATTAFRKTVDRLRRNLPAEGMTLVGTKMTRDKQTGTVTAIWKEGPQSFVPRATLLEAEVENIGDNTTIKTETEVPELFAARKFSVEISDPVPAEFRDLVPTRTVAETIEGIAQFPDLADGELAASEEQVDDIAKRVSSTTRDGTQLPITRHDQELGGIQTHGSEFGGVLDTARTISNVPQEVEQGFDIISSSVKTLGQGMSFRKTTRLATGGVGVGPYLELTDGGEGYVDDPAVVFNFGDRGSGASATAILSDIVPPEPSVPIVASCLYSYNGDAKGVFNFLGELGGGGVWRNPQTNGDIVISAPYDTLEAGSFDDIVDRQPSVVQFVRRNHAELWFDLGEGRSLAPTEFTYRQRSTWNSPCTEFLFQASNDPLVSWDSQHTDVSGTANDWWHKRSLPNLTGAYRYFRIILPEGKEFLSIGEMELYGTLTVQPASVIVPTGHSVTGIQVTAGGQNYAAVPEVEITGDGTGATAVAVLDVLGAVARIDVVTPGENYTTAAVVITVPGAGSGATASATVVAGALTALTVDNGGSGYDEPPIIKIVSASGSGAAGTAVLTDGVVTSIILTNSGFGYLRTPTVILYPAGSPVADAEIGFPIDAVIVDAGGSGYSSVPVAHVVGDGHSAQTQVTLGFPIAGVLVDSGGDDYSSPPTPVFGGGGSFAAGTTTLGHRVAATVVTDGGANYLTAPVVTPSAGNAQFAALVGRPLLNINLSALGGNYTSDPAVVIGGDGTGATAHVTRSFTIDHIDVGAGGSAYIAPVVVIAAPTGLNGHQAVAHAVLTAGVITSIVVTDPGLGYLSSPLITITDSAGSGAAATAALSYGGSINSVVLDLVGSLYSVAPPITFSGGGGSGATAEAVLDTSVSGPIVSVAILNGGSTYTVAPTLTIVPGTSGGTGATAIATLSTSGQVISVTMTNLGEGYTFGTDVTFTGGGGSGAHGLSVLGPTGSVKSVAILSPGEGFRAGAEVEFIGGGGTGARARVAAAECGVVVSLTLTEPGGPFTVAPLVSFVGGLDTGGDSAGGFSSTGSMNGPRTEHTLTLLPDGKVLAAGGAPGSDTAELYDPTTGLWTPTGTMIHPVSGARAALVSTGRVIIIGGNEDSTATQIYDIAAGTWLSGYPLLFGVPGGSPTLTLLANGNLLWVGGYTSSNKAAVYRTSEELWDYTGPPVEDRQEHTATLLLSGKVLIVGGANAPTAAELFDPATEIYAATGSTSQAHRVHTATRLADGKVLVVGCYDEGEIPGKSAEVYDPSTELWTAVASMNVERSYHTAALLPDGTVLVSGGFAPGPGLPAIASAEIYDPVADTWTLISDVARGDHSAVTLDDGCVMIAGGEGADDDLDSVEIYCVGGDGCPTRSAAGLYQIGSSWPVLIEETTDPTEGIIVQITKKIVPYGTALPAGFADSFPLDIYRSIQIVSKVNLQSLPRPDVYHTSQRVDLPSQLLAVTPIWDQNSSFNASQNAGLTTGSVAATVSVRGSILVLKRGGFRGAAIGRVERQFFFGAPPEESVPLPTIIQPTSGTAILRGGSSSSGTSGTTLTHPLNQAGNPAQIGDLMPGSTASNPIYFAGFGIPPAQTSNSGSVGSSTQVVDIGDVLTPGMNFSSNYAAGQHSEAGGLVANANASGTFVVNIPASTPAIIGPGTSILWQVVVEKWRFGLYVRNLVHLTVPAVTL